jgi:RNA polymerase sigma-70 factor (ECF subfamily)
MDEEMRADLQRASDANLVMAIARYHEDALAEVYRRHAGAAYGLANRILRDSAMAEEVVQELFLRLWTAPERFDPERGALRSFLLAQVHGKAVDRLRSESSRRAREARDASTLAGAGYDVEHEVFDLTVAEQVRDALGELPEDQRRPIELAYFGGHSYREVATMLGQPEGTVKSRIRAGLSKMHSTLALAVSAGSDE